MANQLGSLTGATNERILDAIRHDASMDYQQRIPSATKAGVDEVLRKLTDFRPNWNEFENALINRIGMVIGRSKSWDNPLKEFKRGMMNWGDTIEEFQVGLLKAKTYDPDKDYMEEAIFARELPDVQSNFHTLNRQDFYKVTVNESLLKRAFLDGSGLATYVNGLMNAPVSSDNWDEFLLMCALFGKYDDLGGFFRVQIPAVADITSSGDDSRKALRVIRGVAEQMKFISTKYNAAKMPTHADADELILFTTPEFRAAVDVEALAGAFNIERAQIPNRIITIPKERFGMDDVEAVLTTKDFFIIADQKLETTSAFNPVNIHTNYFWHHWQVISASRFVPAVAFTTGPGDDVAVVVPVIDALGAIAISEVDGTAVNTTTGELQRGFIYQASLPNLTTTPANAVEEMGFRPGVRWAVTGAESSKTHISQTGVLTISSTETSESISVHAFDAAEHAAVPTVTVTLSVDVGGEPTPEWPVGDDDEEEVEP